MSTLQELWDELQARDAAYQQYCEALQVNPPKTLQDARAADQEIQRLGQESLDAFAAYSAGILDQRRARLAEANRVFEEVANPATSFGDLIDDLTADLDTSWFHPTPPNEKE